jgi:hypothetical protein
LEGRDGREVGGVFIGGGEIVEGEWVH